jgi:hypothetical protein
MYSSYQFAAVNANKVLISVPVDGLTEKDPSMGGVNVAIEMDACAATLELPTI